MNRFTFDLDGLLMRLSGQNMVVIPVDARAGEHLTVPWAPRSHGKNAGFHTPHITYPETGKRQWLGRFHPSELSSFAGYMEKELRLLWAGASKRITIEDLQAQGWLVLGTDESVFARAKDLFWREPSTFRLGRDAEESLWQLLDMMVDRGIEPMDLQPTKDLRFLLRVVHEERFENAMLGHYPHGLFDQPGWYITRQEDFAEHLYRKVFMRQASEKVVRMLLRICEFLGGEPPDELVELMRQRKAERRP